MNRDKLQRRQPVLVEGSRNFPFRENQVDSSVLLSGRRDSQAIVSFAEESDVRPFNSAIQDSRMTFALFVETKFIPEHVEFKTRAGKTHYQAILKHLIAPELVNRFFDPKGIINARLRSVPEWPYLDEVSLCNLGADHVHRLINAANAAKYSSQTVKHIKTVLFAIIAHAQREGYFNGPNPASLVKLPKVVRRTQYNLSFEQTRAVLQHLRYPIREIAIFTITTGMSLVEICDLRWKHVNLGDSERVVDGEPIPALTLAVRNSWNRDSVGNNRSVGRNRIIEIREPLLSTLRELMQRNPSPQGDSPVLVSDKRGPILPSSIRISDLKHVGKVLGLPWLTWQVLRRTRSSFAGEFLSQLNAPRAVSGTVVSGGGPDSSEAFSRERVSGSARNFDAYRTRGFCFGHRFRGALQPARS